MQLSILTNKSQVNKKLTLLDNENIMSKVVVPYEGTITQHKVDDISSLNDSILSLNSNQCIFIGGINGLKVNEPIKFTTDSKLKDNMFINDYRSLINKKSYDKTDVIARSKNFISTNNQTWALIDYDDDNDDYIKPESLVKILREIEPCFDSVEFLLSYSSSSFVYKGTSDKITPKRSYHLYFKTNSIIFDSLKEHLKIKLFLNKYNNIELDNNDRIRNKSIIDLSVFSPERIILETPPVLSNGLYQNRPANTVIKNITNDGELKTLTLLTKDEKNKYKLLSNEKRKQLRTIKSTQYSIDNKIEIDIAEGKFDNIQKTILPDKYNLETQDFGTMMIVDLIELMKQNKVTSIRVKPPYREGDCGYEAYLNIEKKPNIFSFKSGNILYDIDMKTIEDELRVIDSHVFTGKSKKNMNDYIVTEKNPQIIHALKIYNERLETNTLAIPSIYDKFETVDRFYDGRLHTISDDTVKHIIESNKSNKHPTVINIQYGMGSGKTSKLLPAMCKFHINNKEKVIIVSPLIKLVNQITKTLKKEGISTVGYKETTGSSMNDQKLEKASAIVTTLNSLYRFEDYIKENNTKIIIDEGNSCFNNLLITPMIKKGIVKQQIIDIIESCAKSGNLTVMSADLSDIHFDYLKKLEIKCHVYADSIETKRNYNKNKEVNVFTNKDLMLKNIIDDHLNGIRVAICCDTAKECKRMGIKLQNHIKEDHRIVVLTKEFENKNECVDILENHHKMKNTILIYSPYIQAGYSFTEDLYDKLYINYSCYLNSTTVRQMAGRFRTIKNINIYSNQVNTPTNYLDDNEKRLEVGKQLIDHCNKIDRNNVSMRNFDRAFDPNYKESSPDYYRWNDVTIQLALNDALTKTYRSLIEYYYYTGAIVKFISPEKDDSDEIQKLKDMKNKFKNDLKKANKNHINEIIESGHKMNRNEVCKLSYEYDKMKETNTLPTTDHIAAKIKSVFDIDEINKKIINFYNYGEFEDKIQWFEDSNNEKLIKKIEKDEYDNQICASQKSEISKIKSLFNLCFKFTGISFDSENNHISKINNISFTKTSNNTMKFISILEKHRSIFNDALFKYDINQYITIDKIKKIKLNPIPIINSILKKLSIPIKYKRLGSERTYTYMIDDGKLDLINRYFNVKNSMV